LGTTSTLLGTGVVAWRTVDATQWRLARNNWRTLTALGLIHALDVALENMSLVYITITMNQVIKSTMPAFTILLSW
jgi:drug/metabolite transporter (DMT)-like permease